MYSYGNSSLRGGVTQLSPKQGKVVSTDGNGWSRTVYTVTPGIPGDSGSGFLDASGKAIGVLSTVALAPLPASNGVGDLSRELTYANAHGFSRPCAGERHGAVHARTSWARSSGRASTPPLQSRARMPGSA